MITTSKAPASCEHMAIVAQDCIKDVLVLAADALAVPGAEGAGAAILHNAHIETGMAYFAACLAVALAAPRGTPQTLALGGIQDLNMDACPLPVLAECIAQVLRSASRHLFFGYILARLSGKSSLP